MTTEQEEKIRALALERGDDPDKIIEALRQREEQAAARREAPKTASAPAPAQASAEEQPKLFMYHLPFVTVREVREVWLGLTEAFPGDDFVAQEWANKFPSVQAVKVPE